MQNSVPEASSGINEFTGLQSQRSRGSQNYGATTPSTNTAESFQAPGNISAKRSYLAVGVLCYINLVNYMDWFLVAGILLDIKKYFNISESRAGLLQTVFIISFMLSAPFFGYLGDRYNRKIILSAGIFFWSGATLGSSFIPETHSWIFFLSRGFVGVGTASYSTIAPTIIANLFEKDQRTLILSVFYIFIPVGSGLGYIVASGVTQALGHWQWAFRITPCMGVLALALLILFVPDPAQDAAEGDRGQIINSTTQGADEAHGAQSTASMNWWKDVMSLCKNRSYVWSSLGVTAMSFVTGPLTFWVPVFLSMARLLHEHVPPCLQEPCDSSDSLIFGIITIVTGIVGVLTGAEVARRYRTINSKADPLICAVGMLSSAPCFYLAIILAAQSIVATYIFIALGEFLLSLNWAVVTDILLYVVIPKRQSTAISLQILVSHLLGDASSPYLTALISEAIQTSQNDSYLGQLRSLQYSLILCAFVCVFGGGFFLLTALYVEEDCKEVQQLCRGIENKGYISNEDELQDELPKA